MRQIVTRRTDGSTVVVTDEQRELAPHPSYAGVEWLEAARTVDPRTVTTVSRLAAGTEIAVHRTGGERSHEVDVVLAGELELLLDGGEVLALAAGDIHLARDTARGWRAGPAGATLLTVLSLPPWNHRDNDLV